VPWYSVFPRNPDFSYDRGDRAEAVRTHYPWPKMRGVAIDAIASHVARRRLRPGLRSFSLMLLRGVVGYIIVRVFIKHLVVRVGIWVPSLALPSMSPPPHHFSGNDSTPPLPRRPSAILGRSIEHVQTPARSDVGPGKIRRRRERMDTRRSHPAHWSLKTTPLAVVRAYSRSCHSPPLLRVPAIQPRLTIALVGSSPLTRYSGSGTRRSSLGP